MTDESEIIFRRLAGKSLTAVEHSEFQWRFRFSGNAILQVYAPWRILRDGKISFTSSDHGQKFGHAEPVDGEKRIHELALSKTAGRVEMRNGDLLIFLDHDVCLEALNMSCGFESWEFREGDLSVISLGGGDLAVFEGRPVK